MEEEKIEQHEQSPAIEAPHSPWFFVSYRNAPDHTGLCIHAHTEKEAIAEYHKRTGTICGCDCPDCCRCEKPAASKFFRHLNGIQFSPIYSRAELLAFDYSPAELDAAGIV